METSVSRVEINAGGRQVIVDHDGTDLAYIVEKAQKLWQDTEAVPLPPGPAYGFSMERDPGLSLGWDKRSGGELEPVRVVERRPR
jgi:hypothetical protein